MGSRSETTGTRPRELAPPPRIPRPCRAHGTIPMASSSVGERTDAICLRAIQGETGCTSFPTKVLAAAREACEAVGALLVFDEIQTGLGRTGNRGTKDSSRAAPTSVDDPTRGRGRRPAGGRSGSTTETVVEVLTAGSPGSTFAGDPLIACGLSGRIRIVIDARSCSAVWGGGRPGPMPRGDRRDQRVRGAGDVGAVRGRRCQRTTPSACLSEG